jgi:hypothetical protein
MRVDCQRRTLYAVCCLSHNCRMSSVVGQPHIQMKFLQPLLILWNVFEAYNATLLIGIKRYNYFGCFIWMQDFKCSAFGDLVSINFCCWSGITDVNIAHGFVEWLHISAFCRIYIFFKFKYIKMPTQRLDIFYDISQIILFFNPK